MLSLFLVTFATSTTVEHKEFFNKEGFKVAELTTKTSRSSSSYSSSSSSSDSGGAIIAGILGVGIVVGILAYMLNKNKKNQANTPQKFLLPKRKTDSTTYSTKTSL